MSRSYRRPYSAVTGCRSAADDKRVARRCWRRMQEQALRDCQDWEELVVPKRLEASFNEVYSWGRDGKQKLRFRPTLETYWPWTWCTAEEYYADALKQYQRLCRK